MFVYLKLVIVASFKAMSELCSIPALHLFLEVQYLLFLDDVL